MRKLAVCFFFFVLCSLFSVVPSVHAANEFETSYNVRYQVQPTGRVNINFDISLTNKLSGVYATKYSLSLQSGRIENIQASDEGGPLKTEVKKEAEATVINLIFNQQVVGTGKTLNFNLKYDNLDLAQKNGEVWEIMIPKIANSEEISGFTLWLAVPNSFGNPAFVNPEPAEHRTEKGLNLYRFTKNQLASSGVNAAFGEFQIFDFVLSYHLENPNLRLGETEVAFPPDTAFQRLTYQKISPLPLNLRVDPDGNWLGKYRLGPNEKLNIAATGQVKIFAQAQKNFPRPTPENLNQNLRPQKYWEVDSPLIQDRARKLKTPRQIYNFVVQNLEYDFSRVKEGTERQGALAALQNPKKAICMEFTDLFIALSRAAGIPAREANGYAYTTNVKLKPLSLVSDVLHSWPEYWDEKKQLWLPVDPTWEKTTGGIDYFDKTDLNHFTFATHGESSLEPYPAGSYRGETSFGKDIQVVFGTYKQEENPKITVEFKLPPKIFGRWGGNGEIVVKNLSGQALYDLGLLIQPEKVKLIEPLDGKLQLTTLPPFSFQKINLKIASDGWWHFGKGNLTVLANNQEFRYPLEVGSVIIQLILPIVGIILIIGFLLIFVRKLFRKI